MYLVGVTSLSHDHTIMKEKLAARASRTRWCPLPHCPHVPYVTLGRIHGPMAPGPLAPCPSHRRASFGHDQLIILRPCLRPSCSICVLISLYLLSACMLRCAPTWHVHNRCINYIAYRPRRRRKNSATRAATSRTATSVNGQARHYSTNQQFS